MLLSGILVLLSFSVSKGYHYHYCYFSHSMFIYSYHIHTYFLISIFFPGTLFYSSFLYFLRTTLGNKISHLLSEKNIASHLNNGLLSTESSFLQALIWFHYFLSMSCLLTSYHYSNFYFIEGELPYLWLFLIFFLSLFWVYFYLPCSDSLWFF